MIRKAIGNKIYFIRGRRVMLDRDLAALYGVGTRDLNKSVTRNPDRFPSDFMFLLSPSEFRNLMFQFGTSKRGGTRKRPRAFTEQGIAMLSSVLRSQRAVRVNIQIMRTFVRLRKILASHQDLRRKIEAIEKRFEGRFQEQDQKFLKIFEAIKKILEPPARPKRRIGFHA